MGGCSGSCENTGSYGTGRNYSINSCSTRSCPVSSQQHPYLRNGCSSFYFTSDRLTEEGNEYQLSPETEALAIELRNDQDGYRWSDTPIHYIYQVRKDGEEKGGEGILYPQQGAGSSERIVIQDMAPGVYDIEVQSLSPFEKH